MKRLLLLAGVFVVCAAPGCPAPPVPPPVNPAPVADAAAPSCASTPAICAYCAHMRALGCQEGNPTPAGAPCEVVTENVQRRSYAAMDLDCRASKATCLEANRCR